MCLKFVCAIPSDDSLTPQSIKFAAASAPSPAGLDDKPWCSNHETHDHPFPKLTSMPKHNNLSKNKTSNLI